MIKHIHYCYYYNDNSNSRAFPYDVLPQVWRAQRRAAGRWRMYTRSPSQDFRLFGPRPWKILATYEKVGS